MCGIGGVYDPRGRPADRGRLEAMLGALEHRGPDERGLYRDMHASLVHARLSIVDLRTGQQPMSDAVGRFFVAFNGEVFNYVELREELRARGHTFRTESDTEVFLHAFVEWGERALSRIDGQWAAAVWDSVGRRLVLSRDAFGILPLFYAERGRAVSFASEVKALFAGDPELSRELDADALQQTFTFWTHLAPLSPFRAVREVEPGHVRTYDADGVRDVAWCDPAYPARAGRRHFESTGEATEAVADALGRAAASRVLRADVPVGSYLSGGLDSSLLVALAQRETGRRLSTFGIRFEDDEYDESSFQRLVSSHLETDHHELSVSRRDVADVFPEVVRHAERPLLRAAPAPLFLLSRAVRRAGISVVLTGEGADEVFAGYDLFREGKVRRFWARDPGSKLRPRALALLYPYLRRSPVAHEAIARATFGEGLADADRPGSTHALRWRSTSGLLRLLHPELRARAASRDVVTELLQSMPPASGRWSPLVRDQYLEIRTLLSGLLLAAQGDRMLMAGSIEGRFPFLAQSVVEVASALPDPLKIAGLDEKHVLKRIARDLLPASIAKRDKQPYRAPDAIAFVGPGAPDWVEDLLSDASVRDAGVFDPVAVSRLFAKARARSEGRPPSNRDDMGLVGVLSTQLLHAQMIARPPAVRPAERIETVRDTCSQRRLDAIATRYRSSTTT